MSKIVGCVLLIALGLGPVAAPAALASTSFAQGVPQTNSKKSRKEYQKHEKKSQKKTKKAQKKANKQARENTKLHQAV